MSNRKIKLVTTPHITRYGGRSQNRLECAMEDVLLDNGFLRVEGAGGDALLPYMEQNPGIFKRGFPFGTTLAGHPRIVDFAVSTEHGVILLEAKVQDSRGTAYEKIPFEVQDLQDTGMKWGLIYDGDFIPEPLMDNQRLRTFSDEKGMGIFQFRHFDTLVKHFMMQVRKLQLA